MSKREAQIWSLDSSSNKTKTELSIDKVKTEIVKTLAENLIEYTENNSKETVKKTAQTE